MKFLAKMNVFVLKITSFAQMRHGFGYKMVNCISQNRVVITLSNDVIWIPVRLGFVESVNKISTKIFLLI